VSIVSTTHRIAYASSTICTSNRKNPLVMSDVRKPGDTSVTPTPAMTSSHMTSVAVSPTRASRRLPASDCAEPGSRKFRTTSHQARRVITCGERVSGRRIG
jgi:hypothetical protein